MRAAVGPILHRAMDLMPLTQGQGVLLFRKASLAELMFAAHELRKRHVPGPRVTWQIDRNVSITNVCVAGCRFCSFHCGPRHGRAFITTLPEYAQKIDELYRHGGEQLLLQGGLHPDLGLSFYTNLFRQLKALHPRLKIHALGPPEVAYMARREGLTYRQVLMELIRAGLDSLPGGGAEILVDRVRSAISPGKPNTRAWLGVMAQAHRLGLLTTATMMFGHIETIEERVAHLIKIRRLQSRKPLGAMGFKSFIAWPFQDAHTQLKAQGVRSWVTPHDYLRTVAMSRIMLNNIEHIQASWLTVGVPTAQLALHAGADDLGSIMIEENVVAAAGATHRIDAQAMQRAIAGAGFIPQLRDQAFRHVSLPQCERSRILPLGELRGLQERGWGGEPPPPQADHMAIP